MKESIIDVVESCNVDRLLIEPTGVAKLSDIKKVFAEKELKDVEDKVKNSLDIKREMEYRVVEANRMSRLLVGLMAVEALLPTNRSTKRAALIATAGAYILNRLLNRRRVQVRENIKVTVKDYSERIEKDLDKIEDELQVVITDRNGEVRISGTQEAVDKALKLMKDLVELSTRGNQIQEQSVSYAIELSKDGEEDSLLEMDGDCICHTITGKPIKPKTLGQKRYIEAIREKMIVFGLGPAGTGKTYLAMALAITAFKNHEVERIILTRPAIEAGEKLGFLPGDLQSKVDPYLRPLYDALYQIMGADSFLKNMEKGLIEVAPLAYMRGRTLDNAYIILDEAQNTTPAQMKMFLTRIGFGSKVIITGDASQKDLAPGTQSGLDIAERVLGKISDIAFVKMTNRDVVRHPLVQKIVKAYDEYENSEYKKQTKNNVNSTVFRGKNLR